MPLTPNHHPNAQSLANFLIGDCSPGVALLIARHLELCTRCAARIQAMGAVGGAAGEVSYGPARVLREGIELAPLEGVAGLGEAVLRIRADGGRRLPLGAPHRPAEILVLEGGFTADGESYVAGDFLSLDERPLRQAVSDPRAGCVYLVTSQT
jgi:anti-sigma factor ChrR (cupin superfamily)